MEAIALLTYDLQSFASWIILLTSLCTSTLWTGWKYSVTALGRISVTTSLRTRLKRSLAWMKGIIMDACMASEAYTRWGFELAYVGIYEIFQIDHVDLPGESWAFRSIFGDGSRGALSQLGMS